VAREPVRQPFGRDARELELERVEVRDRWGRDRLAFGETFGRAHEVEQPALGLRGSRALERALGHGIHREAAGQRQALLRAREREVEAERIEVDRRAGEARYAVDEQQHVVVLADHGRDLGERVHDAGRGLVVSEAHGVDVVLGQGLGATPRSSRSSATSSRPAQARRCRR